MNALVYLPPSARPFVRFVVGRRDEEIAGLNGVFRFQKLQNGSTTGEARTDLDRCYAWFDNNVKAPPSTLFTAGKDVSCWFRSDAGEALLRAWDLVMLLQDSGHAIRFIGSDRPGMIIYYDEHQVATERPRVGRHRPWNWEVCLKRPHFGCHVSSLP